MHGYVVPVSGVALNAATFVQEWAIVARHCVATVKGTHTIHPVAWWIVYCGVDYNGLEVLITAETVDVLHSTQRHSALEGEEETVVGL